MGRLKYTEEERKQIMITFIRAAKQVIDREGIKQISIRKIASLTGMNSATMYLYFPNVDVLLTMASLGYLENYCRTLAEDMAEMKSPEDILEHTWDVFCHYAFEYPDIFYHIFYEDLPSSLTSIIDDYYRLFPEHLHNIDGPVLEMLREGPLTERSWKVLWPVVSKQGIPEANARVANDMLVAYFRTLLETRRKTAETEIASGELINKMNRALELVLN
ncbi:MAG: TetR/AcrR family transcriptional regulator [Oscillospiraceae bacterium]|nr:TetR/AcrR family transcriptional regulator [Oscillospiraceae bacterium]